MVKKKILQKNSGTGTAGIFTENTGTGNKKFYRPIPN